MNDNATARNRHGSAVVTLPSETEILITRLFDAPAEAVFRAWTTPELVRRWWGFETAEWLVCDIDLHVGGAWRWVVREGEVEVGFHGEYREIDGPHRLVWTEIYEGMPIDPADAAVNTMTLDERDGVTTMTTLVRHAKAEHRDGHLASGMEYGMQVCYDRMEELVRVLS